jgi:hypothetical protein
MSPWIRLPTQVETHLRSDPGIDRRAWRYGFVKQGFLAHSPSRELSGGSVSETMSVEHRVAEEFEGNVLGPIAEAALGLRAAFILRGPGGRRAGSAPAQGGLSTEAGDPDQA